MTSPRTIAEVIQRVEWARDDVNVAREHRIRWIRKGYLASARTQLDVALTRLRELEREAWEEP